MITRVPNSIENLIHLKCLDLSKSNYIITLPESITRLWNLQTLKVSFCSRLEELPKDIKELVNLRSSSTLMTMIVVLGAICLVD